MHDTRITARGTSASSPEPARSPLVPIPLDHPPVDAPPADEPSIHADAAHLVRVMGGWSSNAWPYATELMDRLGWEAGRLEVAMVEAVRLGQIDRRERPAIEKDPATGKSQMVLRAAATLSPEAARAMGLRLAETPDNARITSRDRWEPLKARRKAIARRGPMQKLGGKRHIVAAADLGESGQKVIDGGGSWGGFLDDEKVRKRQSLPSGCKAVEGNLVEDNSIGDLAPTPAHIAAIDAKERLLKDIALGRIDLATPEGRRTALDRLGPHVNILGCGVPWRANPADRAPKAIPVGPWDDPRLRAEFAAASEEKRLAMAQAVAEPVCVACEGVPLPIGETCLHCLAGGPPSLCTTSAAIEAELALDAIRADEDEAKVAEAEAESKRAEKNARRRDRRATRSRPEPKRPGRPRKPGSSEGPMGTLGGLPVSWPIKIN